ALRRPGAQAELEDVGDDRRFKLVRGDVRDRAVVERLAADVDATINFASEEFTGSGVADGPALARTDIEGTAVLLDAARKFRHQRFLLVSTGEVYGPLKAAANREEDRLAPTRLAASVRAAAETLAGAYQASYGVPVLITRAATAYGPRQPVNQFVASLITSALTGQTVSIAGNGSATRDYLHVDDQVAGIARVLWKGEPGTVYNVGDGVQISGSQLAETILDACGKPSSLKRLTREGSGWSYAVDPRRMRPPGWDPVFRLPNGIPLTVDASLGNDAWWRARDVA